MWSGADVSYLAAITAAAREYTWHGTIVDSDGTSYNFGADDIVAGSGQISRVVSSASSLDIGTVYAAELTIRLFMSINRYKLYNGTITLYCDVDVNGSTYSVPMGVYTISECVQELSCIAITAYDAMTKLDDKTLSADQGTVAPYDWLTYIVGLAGVTLGTSRADIEAMANGTELLTFSLTDKAYNTITCRDALAYICSVLCANAYIGRDGKLYVQQYGTVALDDIAANERFSSSFSDFTTTYTAVRLGVYVRGVSEYYADSPDNGLTWDLGNNPWLQIGTDADREAACRAILADLSGVAYTPYVVTIPLRPELDPMDVLTFSGNQASADIGAITSITYKLGGQTTVKCTGANPRLAQTKSRLEKDLDALTSTVAKEVNQMSVVQNASSVTIGENTETSILTYNFEVTQEENTTMIDVSVVLTATATETLVGETYTLADLVAQLRFYVDNVQVTVYGPEFIIDEGKDTMTFNYSLSGLSVGAHEFDIRLEMDGGSGSVAVGDVHEMLWGYGITFEVYAKEIEVTELPTRTTFYAGQRLDYTVAQISLVYNNGLKDDVTAQCTFDPVAGTVLTADDVGTLTVDVDYDTFYTDFDLTVELLGFDCNVSSVVLPTFGNLTTETLFIADNSNIYVANSYTKSNSSENYAKVTYASLDIDNDGNVTILDSNTIQKDFSNGSMNTRVINGFARIGTKYYIPGSSNYMIDGTFFEMKYVDISDGSSGNMSITYNYLADADAEVYSFGLNEGDPIVVGNYIWMPGVRGAIRKNGTLTTYASTAWIAINGTNATVYILDPSNYSRDYYYIDVFLGTETTRRGYFNQPCYFKYDNGSMSVYDMTCDSYGLHCPLKSTFSTGFTNEPNRKRVSNSNKYVLYQIESYSPLTIKVGLYDYDTDTYSGEWTLSQSDDYDIFNMIFSASGGFESVCWSEDKEMFFYPISSAYETTQTVYASGDFETWIYATCASEQYDIENSASLSYEDGIVTIGQTADSPGIYDFSPATLTFKVD